MCNCNKYIYFYDGIIDSLRRTLRGCGHGIFKVLHQNSSGLTLEIHKRPSTQVSGQWLETGIFQTNSRITVTLGSSNTTWSLSIFIWNRWTEVFIHRTTYQPPTAAKANIYNSSSSTRLKFKSRQLFKLWNYSQEETLERFLDLTGNKELLKTKNTVSKHYTAENCYHNYH
jgi:hypothetical protein